MQNIELLRKILEEAPEGATHIDSDGMYLECDINHTWYAFRAKAGRGNVDNYEIGMYCHIRSLSDIKLIVELYDSLKFCLAWADENPLPVPTNEYHELLERLK